MTPTGVAIRDAREQLFDAAERVLLRDGANALTSRAVTTEAGVAKGLLHRYFADFDAFLAELIEDRIARIAGRSARLSAAAGTGTVVDNLTDVLVDVFDPVAIAVVSLIIVRDELRARLRSNHPQGMPLMNEVGAMFAVYLEAEQGAGRIASDADIGILAPTLVGAGHMLYAGQVGEPPDRRAVRRMVDTVTTSALTLPAKGVGTDRRA
jgi:AcrR family transcriptional regulator